VLHIVNTPDDLVLHTDSDCMIVNCIIVNTPTWCSIQTQTVSRTSSLGSPSTHTTASRRRKRKEVIWQSTHSRPSATCPQPHHKHTV
jgi:hypothetical protein